jgi:ribosomal protein S14
MVFIYILKLEGGKYYVGKTINPEFRLETHFNARGSEWTKLYAPIKVKKVYPDCDAYDENKYTIKYMAKYGERNVRGGSYCRVKLSDDELVEINRQIDGAQDKCMSCGKPGHFIRDCPDRKKEKKKKEKVKKVKPAPARRKFPIRIQCDRCGRAGHLEEECYAETDKDGYEIALETGWGCEYCGKEFESEKGCRYHEKVHCKKKPIRLRKITKYYEQDSDEDNDSMSPGNRCYRCGRPGHKSPECYAGRHLKGYPLS